MKKLFFIAFLFLTSCFYNIPKDEKAQSLVVKHLDSLYQDNNAEDKWGIEFIKITDYLNPVNKDYANRSKQALFKNVVEINTPDNGWKTFTEKLNDILSNKRGDTTDYIVLENYKVNGIKHVTAFLVDSTLEKVVGTIKLK
jgi:hypothetical protein